MHERTLYLGCDSIAHCPGNKCVLESWFEETPYGIIFADDGDTGYFYAAHTEQGILDALHIYNVKDVTDRDIPSTVSLLWDETFDLLRWKSTVTSMPFSISSPSQATAATPSPNPMATGCASRTAFSTTPCSPTC